MDQSDPEFTKKSLKDDADVVEAAIRNLVEEHNETVIVVMHSYGGLVGGEAVSEDLTLQNRQARGLAGGVARFFYCAAFVMPKGQTILAAVGESKDHDTWDGRFQMRDPGPAMYNDLPADEAAYWTERVIPQSSAVMETTIERCAYTHVPSTYVICNGDRALPPQVQDMFAQLAGATVVRRVEAGHSPMLSKPEVMALIEEAAMGVLTE